MTVSRIQLRRALEALEGVSYRKVTEPSPHLFEIDVWVHQRGVKSLRSFANRMGFARVHNIRDDGHRQYVRLEPAGGWTKIDAKIRRPRGRDKVLSVVRLFGRGAVRIALLGGDGAGKSTVSALLAERSPFAARTAYLAAWKPRKLTTTTGHKMTRPQAQVERSMGRQLTRTVGWALRAAARSVPAVRSAHSSTLLICDRHPIERLTSPGLRTEPSIRVLDFLARRVPPRIDHFVLLDAPGDVLHERSGEHTPDVLEQMAARLRAVCDGLPNVTVLDATAPVDDVVGHIEQLVMTQLLERR